MEAINSWTRVSTIFINITSILIGYSIFFLSLQLPQYDPQLMLIPIPFIYNSFHSILICVGLMIIIFSYISYCLTCSFSSIKTDSFNVILMIIHVVLEVPLICVAFVMTQKTARIPNCSQCINSYDLTQFLQTLQIILFLLLFDVTIHCVLLFWFWMGARRNCYHREAQNLLINRMVEEAREENPAKNHGQSHNSIFY